MCMMSWFKRTPKQTKEFKTLVDEMRVKKLQIEKLKKEMEDMAKLMFDPATGKVSMASEKKTETPPTPPTPPPQPAPQAAPEPEKRPVGRPPTQRQPDPVVERTVAPHVQMAQQTPELPQNFEETVEEEQEPQIATVKIIFALPSGQTVLPVPVALEELEVFIQTLDRALITESPLIVGTTRFNTRFILRYDIEVEQ